MEDSHNGKCWIIFILYFLFFLCIELNKKSLYFFFFFPTDDNNAASEILETFAIIIVASLKVKSIGFKLKNKQFFIYIHIDLAACWTWNTKLFIFAIFYCFTFIKGKKSSASFWKIVKSLGWWYSIRKSMAKLIKEILSWWFWFERCSSIRKANPDWQWQNKDINPIKPMLHNTRDCRSIEDQIKKIFTPT